jgi:hypothetical protein
LVVCSISFPTTTKNFSKLCIMAANNVGHSEEEGARQWQNRQDAVVGVPVKASTTTGATTTTTPTGLQPHQVHGQPTMAGQFVHRHLMEVYSVSSESRPQPFHSHVSRFVEWMADKTSGPMTFRLISALLPDAAQPVKMEFCIDGLINIATGGSLTHVPRRWSSLEDATVLKIDCDLQWITVNKEGERFIQCEEFQDEMQLLNCTQIFVSKHRGYAFMLAPLENFIGDDEDDAVWEQSDMFHNIHGGDGCCIRDPIKLRLAYHSGSSRGTSSSSGTSSPSAQVPQPCE